MAPSMSSKLQPLIWSCDTGHIGTHGGVDVCTYGCTDGLLNFLPTVLCVCPFGVRSSAIKMSKLHFGYYVSAFSFQITSSKRLLPGRGC